MPYLYLADQPIRFDTTEVAANLERKGWRIIPDPPSVTSRWNGNAWETPNAEPPEPDIKQFYNSLISSNLYLNKLAPALFSPEPSWVGEPFSVVDAAVKNLLLGITSPPAPNLPEPSLQASIWSFVAVGFQVSALDENDVEEVQALMKNSGLEGIYSLIPPSP